MPKKHNRWRVTVVFTDKAPMAFLDCLRYAGLVLYDQDDPDTCFLIPPAHVAADRQEVWARMNAERINSFGPSLFKANAINLGPQR